MTDNPRYRSIKQNLLDFTKIGSSLKIGTIFLFISGKLLQPGLESEQIHVKGELYGVICLQKFKLLFTTFCFELLLIFTFQYSTSIIQHCAFTIQCLYFKCNMVQTCYNLIQCSICLNGVKCDMLATQSNKIVSAFLINIHILLSNFFV